MPGGGEGWHREVPPYPDRRRNLAVALRPGEGPLTTRFADFRHCAVQASGFGELTIYALASRLSASSTLRFW